MYLLHNKKYLAGLFCITAIGFITAAPALDPDLDPFSPVVLAEKEVRLLEQDLNRTGNWIPEEDMVLLMVKVRRHLNMIPHSDLYSNANFVRAEAAKAMAQFVAKRAEQHASAITNDSRVIANAGKIESNEFMNLLRKDPFRDAKNFYHHFGKPAEVRVKENTITGRKYSYY